jgi:hypothetical protein
MNLDDCATPSGVIDALALTAFIRGEEPWARIIELQRVKPEASLIPEGYRPDRQARSHDRTTALVRGDGWTLRVVHWREGTAELTVTAVDEARGQDILDRLSEAATDESDPESDSVPMAFWRNGGHRGIRRDRNIGIESWPNIRQNYSEGAASALDSLMSIRADDIKGRILMLHGPPGTGKTTALRAVANAWRTWCRLDYVIDPEALFADPAYLMSLMLGDDDRAGKTSWRLVVLEDCDEFIRSDAKQGSGQALSRLLNVTDGLLGQGLEVLVAITTNEPLNRLHPAITRAGRCLAEIEVGPLSPAQCRRWLGRPAQIPTSGMTLAELCLLRSQLTLIKTDKEDEAVGQYL